MTDHEPDDPLGPELRRWFTDHEAPAAPSSLRRFLDELPADHPPTEPLRRTTETSSPGRPPRPGGAAVRTIRLLAIAAALAVLAVASGILLTGGRRPAVSSPTPSATAVLAEASPTATSHPTAPPSSPSGSSLPVLPGFTTPGPAADGATWTGLRWTNLTPTSPSGLVRQVLPWSRGYLALGLTIFVDGRTVTPLWRSVDGQHWSTIPPAVLGDAPFILAIGRAGPGLVVLSSGEVQGRCPGISAPSDICGSPGGKIMSWTSPDGLTWTPHPGPAVDPADVISRSIADGPAGLVLAIPKEEAGIDSTFMVVSSDGATWQTVSDRTLPAETAIASVVGTPAGYVAVGSRTTTMEHQEAVALFSPDGLAWSVTQVLPTTAVSGGIVEASSGPSWFAGQVIAARDGFIAVGGIAAVPGGAYWWHSADGRHWQYVTGFAPLGPTTCEGEGCGGMPDGLLVGDGTRMIAFRGAEGPSEPNVKPGAWESFDGTSWTKLSWTGEAPPVQDQAVVLPSGLLSFDTDMTLSGEIPGSAPEAWFGQALTSVDPVLSPP